MCYTVLYIYYCHAQIKMSESESIKTYCPEASVILYKSLSFSQTSAFLKVSINISTLYFRNYGTTLPLDYSFNNLDD